MDFMSNSFPSEQDTIRLNDFFKISSSILKRELSIEEKNRLTQLIPSTSNLYIKLLIGRWNGGKGQDFVVDLQG